MADKQQEREARRAAREAAEKKQRAKERRRTIIAYAVAGVLAGAIVVGAVFAFVGGDDKKTNTQHLNTDETIAGEMPENARINVLSGSVNDIPGDGREGTPPPPVKLADIEEAAEAASCELNLDLKDEGNTHIQESDPDPEYKQNPPTSGNHILPPLQQADGAYAEYPGDKYIVHSLEHGRIVIQYKPELAEESQLELKGLFDEDAAGMLLVPNPNLPSDVEVAATAWNQQILCGTYEGATTIDALRAFRDVYRGQGPEQVPVYIEQ